MVFAEFVMERSLEERMGFEHRLRQLYRKYEAGEISLGYFAMELGLSIRDLYAVLEERVLPTSNIGANTSTEG